MGRFTFVIEQALPRAVRLAATANGITIRQFIERALVEHLK